MKATTVKKINKEIESCKLAQATIMLKSGEKIELNPEEDYNQELNYVVNEEDNIYEVATINGTYFIDCDEIAMIHI